MGSIDMTLKKRIAVEEYLESLDPKARDLTNQVRDIIKKTLPHVLEEINPRGNPTYTVNGNHIAWIINYKNHIDFGFFMGAKLHSDLLEGTGKVSTSYQSKKRGGYQRKRIRAPPGRGRQNAI